MNKTDIIVGTIIMIVLIGGLFFAYDYSEKEANRQVALAQQRCTDLVNGTLEDHSCFYDCAWPENNTKFKCELVNFYAYGY